MLGHTATSNEPVSSISSISAQISSLFAPIQGPWTIACINMGSMDEISMKDSRIIIHRPAICTKDRIFCTNTGSMDDAGRRARINTGSMDDSGRRARINSGSMDDSGRRARTNIECLDDRNRQVCTKIRFMNNWDRLTSGKQKGGSVRSHLCMVLCCFAIIRPERNGRSRRP